MVGFEPRIGERDFSAANPQRESANATTTATASSDFSRLAKPDERCPVPHQRSASSKLQRPETVMTFHRARKR